MSHYRVLLLDDDEDHMVLLRRALQRLRGVTVELTCCSTCDEARQALTGSGFDLALLDYRLQEGTSESLVRELNDRPDGPPVIVTTSTGDEYLSAEMTRAGAHRYLVKDDANSPRLEEAVHSTVTYGVERRRQRLEQAQARDALDRLTPRERQVAALIAEGLLSKQISARLGCSTGTVNLHRSHLMQKTGAQSVADLVRLVLTAEKS